MASGLASGTNFRAAQRCPRVGGERTLIVPLLGQPGVCGQGHDGAPAPQQPPKPPGQSPEPPATPDPLLHRGIWRIWGSHHGPQGTPTTGCIPSMCEGGVWAGGPRGSPGWGVLVACPGPVDVPVRVAEREAAWAAERPGGDGQALSHGVGSRASRGGGSHAVTYGPAGPPVGPHAGRGEHPPAPTHTPGSEGLCGPTAVLPPPSFTAGTARVSVPWWGRAQG